MSTSVGQTVGIRKSNQAYGASGGLTNDIQLNRGDELLILDRERQDQQEKLLEQSSTIRSLQLHSKSLSNCLSFVRQCSQLSRKTALESYHAEPLRC